MRPLTPPNRDDNQRLVSYARLGVIGCMRRMPGKLRGWRGSGILAVRASILIWRSIATRHRRPICILATWLLYSHTHRHLNDIQLLSNLLKRAQKAPDKTLVLWHLADRAGQCAEGFMH